MHMELRLVAWVVFPLYVKLLINYVCFVYFDEIHFLYKRKRDYRLYFYLRIVFNNMADTLNANVNI